MILKPSGARVWLAAGHTDMRKGFDGLALLVQETLKRDPRSGHLFVFRGRRDGLIKVLWLLFDRIVGGGADGRGLERGQDRRQASQHPACDSTDTFP
jgi:transposase